MVKSKSGKSKGNLKSPYLFKENNSVNSFNKLYGSASKAQKPKIKSKKI